MGRVEGVRARILKWPLWYQEPRVALREASKDTGTSVLQPQGLGELGDGFSGPGRCQTVAHLVGGGERSRAGLQSWVQVSRGHSELLVCAGLSHSNEGL